MKACRKPRRRRRLSFLILAALLPLLSLRPSESAETAVVSVVNLKTGDNRFVFDTNSTISGDRFNATVSIGNVTDLFAYQVYLSVNSTLLSITGAWLPEWDERWVFHGRETVKPAPAFYDFDNDSLAEAVLIGDSVLKGQTAFDGWGPSAIIEFEILQTPPQDSTLTDILNITSKDTYLLDSALKDLPIQVVNGDYMFRWIALARPWLEVSPTRVEFGPLPPSAVGEQFIIEVQVRELSRGWNLTTASFTLSYNDSIVEMSEHEVDPLWDEAASSVTTPSPGIQLVLVSKPVEPPSGDVATVQMSFRVKYQGLHPQVAESALVLSNISLLSSTLQEIPREAPVAGNVKIRGLSEPILLEVLPQETEVKEAPPLAVGKQFSASVALKNLNVTWKLADLSFTLTYNETLIRAVGVTEGSFMPSFGPTEFKSTLVPGKVVVNQSYFQVPPAFPEGAGTVASITFNITWQPPELQSSETTLNLTNIHLTDGNGDDIPQNLAETIHGLFEIKSLERSTINVNVSKASTTAGSNVTISGYITPPLFNRTVTIYVREVNETWKVLKQTETDSQGHYSYPWRTEETGEFEIKALWLGDENISGDESEVARLTVEPSPGAFEQIIYVAIAIVIIIALASTIYYFKRKAK